MSTSWNGATSTGSGALMLSSAETLARAGADFLICPDNTIHQAPSGDPGARSPRPWLHIAEVVADAAAERRCRRVGLTGTRWLVESDVYPDALADRGIACVRPDPAERAEIDRIIMEDLVAGRFTDAAVAVFQRIMARLADQGCDAVVLGCTEIPPDHRRWQRTAADARFHAPARPRRARPGVPARAGAGLTQDRPLPSPVLRRRRRNARDDRHPARPRHRPGRRHRRRQMPASP